MILKSYCKINLYLDIISLRDDGYHNIDTIFQAISLCDSITFEKSSDFTIVSNIKELESNTNVIWKAINLLRPYIHPLNSGLKITLKKVIPMGAGLAGGSSNAATTLIGINNFFSLGITNDQLTKMASKIGADVPFFIKGATARGQGIGDKLTYLDNLNCPLFFLVVYPKINTSTKTAYDNIDLSSPKNKINDIIDALKQKDMDKIANSMYNKFEESQIKLNPTIKEIKTMLTKNGAKASLMSGSGSSVFGLFESMTLAKKAKNKLDHLNYNFFLAESIKPY